MRAHVGVTPEELERLETVPMAAVAPLLDPALERDGVVLLDRADAHARIDPSLHGASFSSRNGRGNRAWINHVLLVPLRDREGNLEGVVWVDEPIDRLLPTPEILQAVRAFANHAMSAVESARQLELMRHLAEHDPLTGLRNRRGLQEHIDAQIAEAGSVAVLVSDLDNFKRVNDALGYVQGDEALRRFAAVLAEAGGLAARLGGEEFALVLPGHDEPSAMAVAERLRAAVPVAFADFPWPVTASIGVAVSGPGTESASLVLRAATRAVFGAKRLGRDRCVVYHAEALETLLGHARRHRRRRVRAARRRDAARRDARPARRQHRPPLPDRRPLRRGDRPHARAARASACSASAPPASCTTSASSASPTRCSRSPAR